VGIIDQGRLVLESKREDLLTRYVTPVLEVDSLPAAIPRLSVIKQKLLTLPWVEGAEVNGARLRLRVRDVSRAQLELLPLLYGLPVSRVELMGATLEDIFLNLTKAPSEEVLT
jgi:hypothetical protein